VAGVMPSFCPEWTSAMRRLRMGAYSRFRAVAPLCRMVFTTSLSTSYLREGEMLSAERLQSPIPSGAALSPAAFRTVLATHQETHSTITSLVRKRYALLMWIHPMRRRSARRSARAQTLPRPAMRRLEGPYLASQVARWSLGSPPWANSLPATHCPLLLTGRG